MRQKEGKLKRGVRERENETEGGKAEERSERERMRQKEGKLKRGVRERE